MKVKKFYRNAITKEDYLELLPMAPNLKIRIILSLLFWFGLRIDETRFITKEDIRKLYTEDYLEILESKTQRVRTLAVPKEAKDDFKDFEFLEEGFIASHEGKQYSRPHFNSKINSILKEYQVKKNGKRLLRSHSFRIGAVTDLLEFQNPENVRQFIGHSSINTTLRYSRYHISREKLSEMADSLYEFRMKKQILQNVNHRIKTALKEKPKNIDDKLKKENKKNRNKANK
jgi:integrase